MKFVESVLIAVLVPILIWLGCFAYARQSLPFFRYTAYDRSEGREIFLTRCARCHNLEESPYLKIGPNLFGLASKKRTVNQQEMTPPEYVLQSLMEPDAFRVPGYGAMPKNQTQGLTERQTRNLIAYLVGDAYESQIARLSIPNPEPPRDEIQITLAEAKIAENVLRQKGQCVACHSIYQLPEYNTLAPNLFQSGYHDREFLKKSIIDPSQTIAESSKQTTIQLADGRVLHGRLVESNEPGQVRMLTINSKGDTDLVTVALSDMDVDENQKPIIIPSNRSIMPEDYDKRLTQEEIDAVSKLIAVLNE